MKTIKILQTKMPEGILLFQQLASSADGDNDITLDFTKSEFINPAGLSFIATWRHTLPPQSVVKIVDGSAPVAAQKLLTNTGFRDIMEKKLVSPQSAFSSPGHVPLNSIVQGTTKESTVAALLPIFDQYQTLIPDPQPLRQMLSELCENVLIHSESDTPSYVCATVQEKTKYLEFGIADAGIGIKKSYETGTNRPVLQRISRGESPISIALDGRNTSKLTHYGYGLWLVKRLTQENGGRMVVISGDEMVTIDGPDTRMAHLKNPWGGTFVGLVWHLAKPLPLEKVYSEGLGKQGFSTSPERREPPTKPIAARKASSARLELRTYGKSLLTRELGMQIRADIATMLARGEKLEISLDGIEDITPSFADEVFAKLYQGLGNDIFSARVSVTGGSPIAKRLIELVLKGR